MYIYTAYFSSTGLIQGIPSALIWTADEQDVQEEDTKKKAGNSRGFVSVNAVKLLDAQTWWGDVWGGTHHRGVRLYVRGREGAWYQQNKSIRYEKGEKVCLSCLGCSLGSCLLVKAESTTQCVLCRMCGLKDGMGLNSEAGLGFPWTVRCRNYL